MVLINENESIPIAWQNERERKNEARFRWLICTDKLCRISSETKIITLSMAFGTSWQLNYDCDCKCRWLERIESWFRNLTWWQHPSSAQVENNAMGINEDEIGDAKQDKKHNKISLWFISMFVDSTILDSTIPSAYDSISLGNLIHFSVFGITQVVRQSKQSNWVCAFRFNEFQRKMFVYFHLLNALWWLHTAPLIRCNKPQWCIKLLCTNNAADSMQLYHWTSSFIQYFIMVNSTSG